MHTRTYARLLFTCVATGLLLLLGGCAPAPIYKPAAGTVQVPPSQVARTPEDYAGQQVIWGGRVVQVANFSDHSEIQVLSYPLDRSQRPRIGDNNGNGRFIVSIPGYVEPLNYPAGSLLTASGTLKGVRSGKVGSAAYVFPIVQSGRIHRWTAEEMRQGHPHFNFGLGVGVGIH